MFFMFLINIYVKFRVNNILFTIRSINLIIYIILNYKNLKFKYTICGARDLMTQPTPCPCQGGDMPRTNDQRPG